MFRSLFSISAIFSLLFASLSVSPVKAAKRCPDEPPSTLLSLYKSSDVIYIGKFDKTVEGDVVSTEENYRTVSKADHFSISTTIKGESRKFFVRDYVDYRYSNEESAPDEEMDTEENNISLKAGANVILFLSYSEESDEARPAVKGKRPLELAHYRDGVRRVDSTELSSYEKRLRELKGILASSKNGSDADVLNWMIRAIEDPVTRWDGAFELLASFETLEWAERQKSEESDDAEEIAEEADESAVEDLDEHSEEEETVEEEEFDNSVYAKLLTEAQKARLMQVAITSKPAKAEEEAVNRQDRDGDSILFDLVKRWGDSKLASVMLDRLRAAGDNNYEKHNWMNSIAEVLKNKELTAIREKFGEVTYQADDDEMHESEADEKDTEAVDEQRTETERIEDQKPEEPTPATNDGIDAGEKPAKKTYRQYREELLTDFITKATALITQDQEKAKAK